MNNQNLWAPWRMAYLRDLKRRADDVGPAEMKPDPFLSNYFEDPDHDERHLVVFRDGDGLLLLNRYPYASGHLLVALGEPRPTLLEYEPPQRVAFWRLVERATELIERTLHPQGINTGINQGTAAGAGLPDHLHAHVVPRWNADTNFITIVGQLRVIPEALEEMWRQYRETVRRLAW